MFDDNAVSKIRHYVYALFDPDQPRVPFYIGKGKGNRVFDHAKGVNLESAEVDGISVKRERITQILRRGKAVRHTIVQYQLDEEQALKVEASLIDMVNHILPETLTNVVSGHGAAESFIDAGDLAIEQNAEPLNESDPNKTPLLLIKIERRWGLLLEQYGASNLVPINELYEATRLDWRIDVDRAAKAKYILSVARGLVRGVFEAAEWSDGLEGRKRFLTRDVNQHAESDLLNKSVTHLFPRGAQTPIRYLNC